MPNEIYESIKEHAPANLPEMIKACLSAHYSDETVSKEIIAREVFKTIAGYKVDKDGYRAPYYLNDTRDRQIRDAVADLVTLTAEPIVTDTVKGGFHMAKEPDEISRNIADCKAREEKIRLRRKGLELALQRFPAVQMRLPL